MARSRDAAPEAFGRLQEIALFRTSRGTQGQTNGYVPTITLDPYLRRRDVLRRAWVLSGGGNRGPLQVGAMRALLERGLEPDFLVGTSAGAINAAAFA
ncbi:patatin-like phospholipase family protein, partial [Thermoflexus hugenholtzii]